ncbi:MAG: hypothetical protein IIZ20_09990, partial [Butyrivibrio sp.]|nr:hypothetical protein [Butyrivibrio sp.]
GRIKISIYHAHEFYKMIKKCDNDLYTAYPCKGLGEADPSKWEVKVYYYMSNHCPLTRSANAHALLISILILSQHFLDVELAFLTKL